MLQDLLGAIALCHDRNIVVKAIDAEKVRGTAGEGGMTRV